MVFRIKLVTTDYVTIERRSVKEAKAEAKELAKEANSHHHHGEKTTAEVVTE